jgi:hypothetical protein
VREKRERKALKKQAAIEAKNAPPPEETDEIEGEEDTEGAEPSGTGVSDEPVSDAPAPDVPEAD